MSSDILYATVFNHFSLIFSAQSFSIEQGHSFVKWLSRADGGRSLICTEERVHAVARVPGGGGGSGRSRAGVRARTIAWLDQTVRLVQVMDLYIYNIT
jgi:hypothetical protein